MTDKIEEPDELESCWRIPWSLRAISRPRQLDLEAFGIQSGAKTLPDGRGNRGSGRGGG